MRVIQGIKNLSFVNFAITFLIIRFISIANSFPARIDSDSGSYTSGDGFTNWNWVSFSGSEFGRGWPSVLLFSLVSSNSGRIFILQIINLTAWIFFGFAGSAYLNRKNQTYFLYFLLFVGNSIAGQQWNNWIGRESFAFSLTLLATSLHLLWISRPNRKFLFLTLLFVSLYAVTKPSLIFIGLIQFLLIIIRLYKKSGILSSKILSLVFVLAFSIYTLVNIGNQDQGWGNADPTGRTTKEIAYTYLTSDFNPNSTELRNYFGKNGAPSCAILNQPSTQNNLGGPMQHAAELHSTCKGFSNWVNTSFYPRYFLYSLAHLDSVSELVGNQIQDAFTFTNNVSYFEILPSFQLKLIDYVTIAAFFYLIFLFSLNFKYLKNQKSFGVLTMLTVASFTSILFSLLIQPTHPSDISRQNYVSSLMFRLLIVFMALIAKSNISNKNKGEYYFKIH